MYVCMYTCVCVLVLVCVAPSLAPWLDQPVLPSLPVYTSLLTRAIQQRCYSVYYIVLYNTSILPHSSYNHSLVYSAYIVLL